MSNNISADLARFNGEIGPQYLDVEDKTGGPDGTMKPITKEVLREMIVTNFPDLMDVNDKAAQDKLDALDNKLQELDQKLMTLDEIKTQLEGTINTQLTGSNVAQPVDLQYHDLEDNPLPIKEKPAIDILYETTAGSLGITVEPGESHQLLDAEERREYRKIIVAVRCVSGTYQWRIGLRHLSASDFFLFSDHKEGGQEFKVVFDNLTARYDLVMYNDHESARTIQRYTIVGVR